MSRRSLLVTALGAAILLPGAAAAQAPSPSVAPAPVRTTAAATSATSASATEAGAGFLVGVAAEPAPDVDFKVGDWKLQKIRWKDLRFNGRAPLRRKTEGPQDEKSIPMRPLGPGGGLVYNPTVLAQQGMKRLDAYAQTRDKYHLRQARKYAEMLKKLSDGGKRRRWQPHWYDLGIHESGWVNANSHGLALSFLSRYYKLTGAPERLEQAKLLMGAFEQRPGKQRWFSDVTGKRYIWFEHWPEGRNEHTLNAHLNAMFGIYEYWLATGDPLAEQYFLGGARTVRDKLYRFRRKGELSRYSLASTEGSLHYHETHIEQLRILAKMTGDTWFDEQADRLERDEEQWRAKYRGGGR